MFDRDIFLKLICCDLWDETLAATGITQPRRLPSANAKGAERQLGRWFPDAAQREQVRHRVATTVAAVPPIDAAIAEAVRHSTAYVTMMETEGIDAGEAVLVGILSATDAPCVMATGDKRFLAALRQHFPATFENIRRRVLTLERCLLLVTQSHGAQFVIQKTRNAAACDRVVAIAVGASDRTDPNSFVAALRSYDEIPDDQE